MSSWHLRTPHFEHIQRFQNLIDLHQITRRWANHFQVLISHPEFKSNPSLNPDAWMLDLLEQPQLEAFLVESYPDELLDRLERLILKTQTLLLNSLLSANKTNKDSTLSTLEQESWRAGKECAEQRWKTLISIRKKISLTETALAFYHSPFSNYPHSEPFLVQRSTSDQVWLTRQNCPHSCEIPEVKTLADTLCSLQMHWMRGFSFSLNSSVQIEVQDPLKSCTQRWHLYETHESKE